MTVAGPPTAWSVIRGNGAYRIFLASTLVSFLGSTVHIVAAAWLILELTGEAYSVPLLLLFSALPGVLLSPLIGELVDRVESRRLLIAVDLASAAAVVTLPLLSTLDLTAWHLYVVEFVLAFLGQLYGPASKVFVRRLARPEELLAANATVTLVYQLGIALGALVGGILVATAGPVTGLLVNAVSFAVSGLALVAVRRDATGPEDGTGTTPMRLRGSTRRLLRTITTDSTVTHLTALYLGLQSMHRLLASLLAPFVVQSSAGPATQGVLQTGYSLGAVAAGAVIPVLARRVGRPGMLLLGSVGTAALVAVFPAIDPRWLSTLAYAAVGLCVSTWVYHLTAAQERVAADRQGRYFAATGALQSLGGIAVFAIGTVALQIWSASTLYVAAAAVFAAAGLPSVIALYRRPAAAPAEQEQG